MKVIFSTNLPSPYRVDFFNELGKYCDLTVLYERESSAERDKAWVGDKARNFREVYLNLTPVGIDRSKGSALKEYIKSAQYDILIFTNYVSPSTMEAITWCRLHRIPYYIEYDGGFNKKDPAHKRILKKFLLGGAKGHFTTADIHIQYLIGLGIDEKIIYKYPFTSIRLSDIENAGLPTSQRRQEYRNRLQINYSKVIVAVGQFIHRKGFDVLIQSISGLGPDVGVYIIGGMPTEEYLEMKENLNLSNLHFCGFMSKSELADWYKATDLLVMPTREDIWGLVVNEAMAFGVPVISTDRCVAALEMVKIGQNGFIVESDNQDQLSDMIKHQLTLLEESDTFYMNAQSAAKQFTIEEMAKRHAELFCQLINGYKNTSI